MWRIAEHDTLAQVQDAVQGCDAVEDHWELLLAQEFEVLVEDLHDAVLVGRILVGRGVGRNGRVEAPVMPAYVAGVGRRGHMPEKLAGCEVELHHGVDEPAVYGIVGDRNALHVAVRAGRLESVLFRHEERQRGSGRMKKCKSCSSCTENECQFFHGANYTRFPLAATSAILAEATAKWIGDYANGIQSMP